MYTYAKLYKLLQIDKRKSQNTIKIRIIQNKVCIPHADTEHFGHKVHHY